MIISFIKTISLILIENMKNVVVLLIVILSFGLLSCKKTEDKKLTTHKGITNNQKIEKITTTDSTSSAHYDRSYDPKKVLPLADSISGYNMEGYVYNLIDIYLHIHSDNKKTDNSENLRIKTHFNKWLKTKTPLDFKNKVLDDAVNFSSWLVEFPNATKEEMESIVKILEEDIEVHFVSYYETILPEYDTKENWKKLKQGSIDFD
jgi:hypothetical protein